MALRITHLRLVNWRNFRSVDVDLQARTFLIGPNASGKSNFLDAIRFLRDLTPGGGLQWALGDPRGGLSAVRCLAARQQSDVGIRVTIGTDDEPTLWDYEVQFNRHRSLKVPAVVAERVRKQGEVLLERPNAEDRSDPERLTQTYLEQVNANREFRELAQFLSSIRYLHLVPQLVRDPDRSAGRKDDPYGGDFLERVAATPKGVRDRRLARIQKALAVAVPQLKQLELDSDPGGRWHLLGRYEHWRPAGAKQNERQLSDGTLRLLGLLWAILDGEGPLLLEEPELSLHAEVVRRLPQLMARAQGKSGRQIIVSTHSPDLLSDPGLALDEVLLLGPSSEGTTVEPARSRREIRELVEGGMPIGEAVLPHTRPRNVDQLSLFAAK